MRTSYGELVTSWWQFVGKLRTICGITFQSIASNYQQSLKLGKAAPSSADLLPHFWHRSGTDVAISWRLKMSSKVLPKNRVMCLKNLGGVWGGCLPTLEVKKTCGKILAGVRGKNNNLSGGRNHLRAALVPKILARRKPLTNALSLVCHWKCWRRFQVTKPCLLGKNI